MDEIESLRTEAAEIQKDRRREVAHRHEEKLSSRRLPPMAQMTRIQKRYFLEPWMTTLGLASFAISISGFIAAMFTPMHVEFAMLGVLFVCLGAGLIATKLTLMDWNSRTEGELKPPRRDYDLY